MDNATNYDLNGHDLHGWDLDGSDLDEWLEISNSDERQAKGNRKPKKRRRPLRKNRKPSRPANYIGQRSNNHLLRMFSSGNPGQLRTEK